MRLEEQIRQGEKLLHFIDTSTTAMASDVYLQNVSDYTCSEQAALERRIFFEEGPIIIGMSCLLPNPCDYITHDLTGRPIVVVRQTDGTLKAFLNVCRHRGARIAEGCGNVKLFRCPYHAWSYGPDGHLRGRPDDRSFCDVDKEGLVLRQLPVAEKYGLIWVTPTPDTEAIDPDLLLGGLASEFGGYNLENYHHYESRTLKRNLNWKLVIDTFLETYHLQFLHSNTIYPILHSNVGTFDGYGRNLRMIAARRTIDQLRTTPKENWNIIPHTAIIYVLFPNTTFVVQGDHIEIWHSYPDEDNPNKSIMRAAFYTPEAASTEKARKYWGKNFDLLMATVEDEDFPMAEGIQVGFRSPAQSTIHFGRNEPALQHFHKEVKSALKERH